MAIDNPTAQEEVKLPLECKVVDGVLTITVNAATVKFATENHEEFWDADTDTYRYKVTDPAEWLESVCRRINAELGEDGSTLLTRMFDNAIYEAAEQGEEGLDYENE
jgi:hypothetical protein